MKRTACQIARLGINTATRNRSWSAGLVVPAQEKFRSIARLALCDGGASEDGPQDEDGTVGPPDLGDRERPTFFRLDADKRELTLLAPESRRGEVTKLESVREVDGQRVFSGVENGRVITIIVAADGRMTLSVIKDGVVWSVFGHALAEGGTK